MDKPNLKISIVTASYNYADLISQTIDSVINQTYSNWELIIVDDGSSDNSREIIAQYCVKDSRIKLYTHEKNQNKGLCETVRLGCQYAQGEYVAFLESDDLWTENYLAEKIKVIEKNPDISLIFNSVELFGDAESRKRHDEYFIFQKFFLKDKKYPANLFKYFLFMNIIPTFSCVMVKNSVFSTLKFNAPFQPHLDQYLWMQIAYNNDVYYLDLPLTQWRIHKQSFIARTETVKRNNNHIIYETIKSVIANSTHSNELLKYFLINYYAFKMILFKIFRGFLKKIVMRYSK